MQLDSFDENLQEILANANIVHAFGYGEPTIHPNFKTLLSQLSEYGVWVDFFTHGMHLSQELCDFLVQQKIGQISVSFSGASQEDYESIYIGGKYQRVLDGLARLQQTKLKNASRYPEVHINSIAFKHHVSKLPEFVTLASTVGVNVINLKPLDTYDPIPELHQHVSLLSSAQDIEILKTSGTLAQSLGIELKVSAETELLTPDAAQEELGRRHKGGVLDDRIIPLVEVSERAHAAMKAKDYNRGTIEQDGGITQRRLYTAQDPNIEIASDQPGCLEPLNTMYIDLNGHVRPCCFAEGKKVHMGVIKEQTGSAIWQSDTFHNVQDALARKQYPKDLCEMCVKSSSYPRVTPNRALGLLRTLFETRPLRFIPWWFILPALASAYAKFLPTPGRAKFIAKVNKAFLWVGMSRRQQAQI